MSGIYIKGMEMPKNCDSCMFSRRSIHNIDWCVLTEKDLPCDCPIVPVPPHGDLISRSALIADLMDRGIEGIQTDDWHEIQQAIMDAPTIIPASEEGAKTEEDSEPWLCLSCRHYPPSSTDGKPCSQCNPSEVFHSCYDPAEEGE